MLPTERRLKKAKEFQDVFSKGKGFQGGGLFLRVTRQDGKKTKFGIVVSKKVSKKAVTRNRIRRVLASAIAQEIERVQEGIEAAIIVLPGFEETGLEEVQRKIHKLFEKASLFQ